MVNAKSRGGFNKDDEIFLQDFSKNVSGKCSRSPLRERLYRSTPWTFRDPPPNLVMRAVMTLLSTWLVSFAYRNVKHILKHKIAVKREAPSTRYYPPDNQF
ncbi:Translocon-associated protein subunit gamma, partial [Caligus rogercresseyi]